MTEMTLKGAVAARAAAQEAHKYEKAALLDQFITWSRESDRLALDLHRVERRLAFIRDDLAAWDRGGAA